MHLPRVNIYIRLKTRLRIIVVKLPNRSVARSNRERDLIDSDTYTWKNGDGIMKGGAGEKGIAKRETGDMVVLMSLIFCKNFDIIKT